MYQESYFDNIEDTIEDSIDDAENLDQLNKVNDALTTLESYKETELSAFSYKIDNLRNRYNKKLARLEKKKK